MNLVGFCGIAFFSFSRRIISFCMNTFMYVIIFFILISFDNIKRL